MAFRRWRRLCRRRLLVLQDVGQRYLLHLLHGLRLVMVRDAHRNLGHLFDQLELLIILVVLEGHKGFLRLGHFFQLNFLEVDELVVGIGLW